MRTDEGAAQKRLTKQPRPFQVPVCHFQSLARALVASALLIKLRSKSHTASAYRDTARDLVRKVPCQQHQKNEKTHPVFHEQRSRSDPHWIFLLFQKSVSPSSLPRCKKRNGKRWVFLKGLLSVLLATRFFNSPCDDWDWCGKIEIAVIDRENLIQSVAAD